MTQAHGRLYALDGLRASMMLLGLVIHTVINYGVVEYSVWPFKDAATTSLADDTVTFIHVFRMPIFFTLAGFFAAMLYLRRGASGLLRNRFARVGIPFLVGWAMLYPLVMGGFAFAESAQRGSFADGWAAVLAKAADGSLFLGDSTMHLWFLYVLLYLYLIALLLCALAGLLPGWLKDSFMSVFRRVMARPVLRTLVLAAITAAMLYAMGGYLITVTSFVPDVRVLLGYSLFFFFGWLFYLEMDLLEGVRRLAWTQCIAAVVLHLATDPLIGMFAAGDSASATAIAIRSASGALCVWWLFFGLTGLFLRYFDQPSPVVRYVVDASYWVYLVHLPMTIWIPGLISGLDVGVWAKMAIVLSVTTFIGFLSYDLLVRPSIIGKTLNGRRYVRGLPGTEELRTAPALNAQS